MIREKMSFENEIINLTFTPLLKGDLLRFKGRGTPSKLSL
jgi:hypothetical protein